jgi:hypothetical protein
MPVEPVRVREERLLPAGNDEEVFEVGVAVCPPGGITPHITQIWLCSSFDNDVKVAVDPRTSSASAPVPPDGSVKMSPVSGGGVMCFWLSQLGWQSIPPRSLQPIGFCYLYFRSRMCSGISDFHVAKRWLGAVLGETSLRRGRSCCRIGLLVAC